MAPKLLLKIRKEYYTKMVQDLSDPQMRWTITCMVDGLTGQYVSDVSFSCPNLDCHYRTVLQNFYTGSPGSGYQAWHYRRIRYQELILARGRRLRTIFIIPIVGQPENIDQPFPRFVSTRNCNINLLSMISVRRSECKHYIGTNGGIRKSNARNSPTRFYSDPSCNFTTKKMKKQRKMDSARSQMARET